MFCGHPGLIQDLLSSARFSQPVRAHRDPSPRHRKTGTARLDRDRLSLRLLVRP
jgi:hypothetical protein